MNVIKTVGWFLAAMFAVAFALNRVHAQTAPPDNIASLAADSLGLRQADPMDVPVAGSTCWWVLPGGSTVPMPFLPADSSGGIWEIAPQVFVVDNSGGSAPLNPRRFGLPANATAASAVAAEVQNLIDQITQIQTTAALQQARAMGLAADLPGFGDSGTNGGLPGGLISARPDYGTNLFLAMNAATNGVLSLVLSNTAYTGTGEVYAVMSAPDLTSGWNVTTQVWADSNQNWIAFTVPMSSPTNLFVWAKDWTGVDSDGDGVPDWWAWEYWGTNNVPDTNADYSGATTTQGRPETFWYDYSKNITPTVYQFTGLAVTNIYASASLVPVQMAVAGYPYYMAVLVDDTNFNDAVWNNYNGPNLTVNLGALAGWHGVWVGLRGHADAASAAQWHYLHLNLTLPSPQFAITTPLAGVVAQPMIQVYGYSPQPLAGLSYSLSNAVGVATGLPAEINSQYYDTNVGSFTTNSFSCLDVPLAVGLNTLTLYATDRAGNLLSTNINYTLSYAGKTNPPTVSFMYPADGTLICGAEFDCCRVVSDPTATVTAQISSTNGSATTINGLVERNGKFWLENIPLGGGANTLTLTVVDAAGNTSVTNLSVVPSALVLTINPVPAANLWNSTVNLTGTVSLTNQAVSVNGVLAEVSGNTWSANNVPTTPPGSSPGGTAVFVAQAAVSGGPGNGSPSGTVEQDQDKPPRLYVKSYTVNDLGSSTEPENLLTGYSSDPESDNAAYYVDDIENNTQTSAYSVNWNDGVAGSATWTSYSYGTLEETAPLANYPIYMTSILQETSIWTWAANLWPDLTSLETNIMLDIFTDTEPPVWWRSPPFTNNYYSGGSGPPLPVQEHCDIIVSYTSDQNYCNGQFDDYSSIELRQAQAKMCLQTGGKALPNVRNLFALQCSATTMADPTFSEEECWGAYFDTGAVSNIPPQNISLGSFGVGVNLFL